MSARRVQRVLGAAASTLLVWLLGVFGLAPVVVRLGYSGRAGALIGGIFEGRSTQSVDVYLDAWYGLARAGTVGVLAVLIAGVLLWLWPERRRALVTRAFAGPAGLHASALIEYALYWGVLIGLTEAAYAMGRHLITQRPAAQFYWEMLWMAPVAAGAAATILGLVGAGVAALGDGRIGFQKATLPFAFCMAYGVLQAEGVPLFPVAAAILSLGIASVLTQFLETRAERLLAGLTRARRPALASALVVMVTAAAHVPTVAEWRAQRGRDSADESLPNVVLIILDTVRAASLSLYGHERMSTPRLDAWAEEGIVYERAYATAPWTLPTHASLFTGRHPYETQTGVQSPLDDRFPTISEVLRDNGYATGGFVANMIYTTPVSGLSRGFDRYEAWPLSSGLVVASSWMTRFMTRPLRRRARWTRVERKDAEDLTDSFLQWSASVDGRPYFAFLNYYDAHEPYAPPARFATMFGERPAASWDELKAGWDGTPTGPEVEELRRWEGQYEGAIRYIDEQLERIRQELAARGELENTLVIVTSDHGEMWGEHGQISHPHSLYSPLLRVPLVVFDPRPASLPGRVLNGVTLRDVPATILDWIGIDDGQMLPGTPLARPGSSEDVVPSPILAELEPLVFIPDWGRVALGDMRSIVDGSLYYIRNGDGSEELYDELQDPGQDRNLARDSAHESDLNRAREAFRAAYAPPAADSVARR